MKKIRKFFEKIIVFMILPIWFLFVLLEELWEIINK
jgi:hypothetical protein